MSRAVRGSGAPGYIAVSRDPTGGVDAWTATNNFSVVPSAFSCASQSLCVATGGSTVVTSTDPVAGASAWHAESIPTAGYNSLQAISCPSRSFCAAVDNAGNVITSTHPGASARAWKTAQLGLSKQNIITGADFFLSGGISCPSASFCAALDAAGDLLTSNRPTGGASAWTVTRLFYGPSGGQGLSCPTASLCVAFSGGEILASTHPAAGASAWTLQYTNPANNPICKEGCPALIAALTCRTTRLCVAFDDVGDVLSSTDPAGGSGAWRIHNVDVSNCQLGCFGGGVSCPSVSLCFAQPGTLVTSHSPGSGAWKIAPPTNSEEPTLSPESCPSSRLCVGVSNMGDLLVSTKPTKRWSTAYVDHSDITSALYGAGVTKGATGVACPSVSLCVAIDASGNVIIGKRPSH